MSMTPKQLQGVKQGLFALNVTPNTILVVDPTVIDIDALCTDQELGKWMFQRAICPSIICAVPRRGESLTDAIKTIPIEELERILAEAKAEQAKVISIGKPKESILPLKGH